MKASMGALVLGLVVACLVAGEPVARAQPAPPPTKEPGGVRVTMTLPQMPPTRTYCTFDVTGGAESNDSLTFEWDPLKPRSLVRQGTLVLTDRTGTEVQVSCHAEPARHAIEAQVNYAWRLLDKKKKACKVASQPAAQPSVTPADDCASFKFCDPTDEPRTACSPQATNPSASEVTATIRFDELPTLWAPGKQLTGLSASAARNPFSPAARAFGGLSDQALGELFQVIAEVVVEKAKSKGLKLAQAKLVQLLCEELASVPDIRKPDVKSPIFPRTCDSVRSVRLDDLAGAGRQLLQAIAQDVVIQATSFITENVGSTLRTYLKPTLAPNPLMEKAFQELLTLSLETAVDAAGGKHERLKSSGQRVLVALAKVGQASFKQTEDWSKGAPPEAVRAFSIALAILRDCHESGRCDQARLDWMMQSPALFFKIDDLKAPALALPAGWKGPPPSNAPGDLLAAALAKWPEARSFITTALKILSPPPDTTESDQLRAALGLVFDTLDLFAHGATGKLSASTFSTVTGVDLSDQFAMDVGAQLRLLRELFDAAVAQDLQRLSTSGMRLVAFSLRRLSIDSKYLQKFGQLAAAAGSYLVTYTSGREPSKEEIAERREARKAALSALIDAQTERSGRFGITNGLVLSVGGSLGLLGAAQFESTGKYENRTRIQPSLTVGFALDWHLSETGFGLHFEAMPLNLGSYLALSDKPGDGTEDEAVSSVAEPTPGDAISPSLTLGMSYVVRSADLVTFLGITGGYASKIGTTDSDIKSYSGFYLGGTLGAYIPFFDFN